MAEATQAGLPALVLASGSRFRRAMLEAAGVVFDVVPADVDEPALRARLEAQVPRPSPPEIAIDLARAKALQVAARRSAALVIGADQVLALEGEIFGKPPTPAAARAHLLRLRGRAHVLHSAVVLARGETVLWSHVEAARLQMRPFSEAFLERYLGELGNRACDTIGAYELEGRGGQLFDRVEGDYFTVIGLPLLPLLAELRVQGVLAT